MIKLGEGVLNVIYPVGSIYFSINSTNPGQIFGGTWSQIAQGRTLVGVDINDTDFNTVGKTGGEKKHILNISEMPSHNHTYNGFPEGNQVSWKDPYRKLVYINNDTNPYPNQAGLNFTGGGQAHNNLQPYFTCYIWCRTA